MEKYPDPGSPSMWSICQSWSEKIQEHYSLTNGQALTGSDIVHAFNDNIRLLGPVTKLYATDWSYWLVQVHVFHEHHDNDKLLTSGEDTYQVDMTRLSHE